MLKALFGRNHSPKGLYRCLLRVGLPVGGLLATAALLTAAFRVPAYNPLGKEHSALKREDPTKPSRPGPTVLSLSSRSGSTAAEGGSKPSLLSGAVLRNRAGKVVSKSELKGKSVALLFAAAWCPSCAEYSPKVLAFYEGVNSTPGGKAIEIVMVSSDLSKEGMQQHLKTYPWLAVDFDDPRRSELKRQHKVWAMKEAGDFAPESRDSGIPTLVVIDEEGKQLERIRLELTGVKGLQAWKFKEWAWKE